MLPPAILVVEDDSDFLLLVERAFQRTGVQHRLASVRNGEDALAYLSGNGPYGDRLSYPFPCLLFLDLKMPRMSGFDVLKWLRRQGGLKRLRVVIFSSSAEPQDVNAAADLGANSYLVKPVAFQDLLATISSALGYWLQLDQKPQCA